MVDPQQECLEDNTRGQKIRVLNCFKTTSRVLYFKTLLFSNEVF